jgi:uncharacterized protein YjiK
MYGCNFHYRKGNFNQLYAFLSLFFFLIVSACSKQKAEVAAETIHYDFSHPAKKYILKHQLVEISGLSFVSDDEVALIQDEDGIIFFFNLEKGEVTRKISFGKDGDYEDLEVSGDTVFVLRSDGRLFEVSNLYGDKSEIKINKINTGLSAKNNTEGLCYDKTQGIFFIACKGEAGDGKKYIGKKAVYSFNLASKKLSDAPFALIDEKEIMSKKEGGKRSWIIDKLIELFDPAKNDGIFQPSGISVHPFTNEIYIISAVSNLLVILDNSGKLKHVIKLSSSVFKQPEGIAFDTEGNLFISNEGRKGSGNILKFLYLKN